LPAGHGSSYTIVQGLDLLRSNVIFSGWYILPNQEMFHENLYVISCGIEWSSILCRTKSSTYQL